MSTVRDISLDVDMLASLPAKSLLSFVSKYREVKKYFAQAQKALQDHAPLFLMLEEMDIDLRFDPDYYSIGVNFSGDGPRLGKVWGELRRHGYTCDTRPKKGDTSFSGSFHQEGYARISVYFTSTMCRRVQVGTQTVEQPIYETICGEDPSIAAEDGRPALSVVDGGKDAIPF